jgi:hypothetical protein
MNTLSEKMVYDTPIEMLRHMVGSFDRCNESFMDDKAVPQLLTIYNCWMRSGWLIRPDEWTTKQVKEAMEGIAPDWDAKERPVFHKDRSETRFIGAFEIVWKGER